MGFLTTLDPAWESILRLRTKYVFIDSSLYNKLFLTAAHVLIFVVVYKSFLLERQIKKIYWVLFVTSMTLFIIPIFTIEILKIDFFTQVQFYRTIFLLKMLNIIFFIHYTYSYFKTVKYNIIYKSMLLGVIASFIFYEYLIFVFMPITFLLWLMKKQKIRPIGWNIEMKYFLPFVILTIIFLANFSIEPKYFKDEKLMELCGWIKENMGIEDVFLVEPFSKDTQAVRTVCLRSVFFFWDDGTQAPFNRDYAFEWKKRYDITLELKNDPEKIYGIDYRIDYILSENELPLNLVFNNSKYFVYKIR